jgi:hypothetical protein
VPILRELGAGAQIVAPEPNTRKEVVDAVASLPERCIAVQEYGRPNPEMTAALEKLGAIVTPFAIYRRERLPMSLPFAKQPVSSRRNPSIWCCSPPTSNSITCSKSRAIKASKTMSCAL